MYIVYIESIVSTLFAPGMYILQGLFLDDFQRGMKLVLPL